MTAFHTDVSPAELAAAAKQARAAIKVIKRYVRQAFPEFLSDTGLKAPHPHDPETDVRLAVMQILLFAIENPDRPLPCENADKT